MRAYWLADADEPSARVRAGPRGAVDVSVWMSTKVGSSHSATRVFRKGSGLRVSAAVQGLSVRSKLSNFLNIGNKCDCMAHQSCGTQLYQDRFAREIVTGCSIVFTVLKMWFNVSPLNLVKVAIFSQFIHCQWSSEPRSFQNNVSYFAYVGKKTIGRTENNRCCQRN